MPGQVVRDRAAQRRWGSLLNEFKYQFSGNKITNDDPEAYRNTRAQLGIDDPRAVP